MSVELRHSSTQRQSTLRAALVGWPCQADPPQAAIMSLIGRVRCVPGGISAYIHRHAHPQKYSASARGLRRAVHGGAGEMLVELVGTPPLQRRKLGSRDTRKTARPL